MVGENGSTFTCKCGKTQGCIYEGLEKEEPCPECGRRYRGVYNRKKYTIDAIEIKHTPSYSGGTNEPVERI